MVPMEIEEITGKYYLIKSRVWLGLVVEVERGKCGGMSCFEMID